MDLIDAFPEHLSTTVVPVTLPDKPDALEYAARQGQVRVGIIYQEPTAKRTQRRDVGKNIQRPVEKSRQTAQKYRQENGLHLQHIFCQKDFYLGLRTVKSGEIHLIQTTHVPILIYELPPSSLKCRAQPNVIRRSFEPHDQMLYHRTILEPHTAYSIPAGTHYIVLNVQKTTFGLDIIPESLLPQLIQKGFHVGDFQKMKKFNQTPYKLPPPTPIHVPVEKRPLEEKALPKKRVRITPVMRCVSRRSELPMAPVQIPLVLEPVPIPDVQESVQIPLVPQPPVRIPDVLEPVQIQLVPQPPVQIPDVLEPVQIPDVPPSLVHIPQPPVQIPDVLEPNVQIPDVLEPVQIPDVLEPVQIPVSQVPEPPVQIPLVQIPDVPEHVQIPMSQVPQPPMQILPEPMNILHVPEHVQIKCHKSHSHLCRFSQNLCRFYMYQNLRRFQCHKSHSHLCRFYMYQNLCKFQCHKSHSHLCRVSQNLCSFSQSSTFWTLWSRQMHSTSSCRSYLDPKNSSCFTRYPLFLMRIASPSWMNLKGSLWT
ncbi:uncharacterized protein TNCV_2805381 [Trichonephila clavipes]|nr:uncharacterized protein TNCV_2805381 [Trichonephila clavipes]